jgi:ketosteroid isomerase-like protein
MRDAEAEAEIRRIEEIFFDPNFDVDEVLSYIDPDEFVSFDFMYNIVGKKAHEEHLRRMKAIVPKLTGEILRMEIQAGKDFGFVNSIQHITLFDDAGNVTYDGNLRVTICYRKKDGKWLQVAQHASVPLDMQTGQPDFKSVW